MGGGAGRVERRMFEQPDALGLLAPGDGLHMRVHGRHGLG